VVDDVALRLHVLAFADLNRETFTQRCDQRLLDSRDGLSAALDVHRVADAQLLLLHGVELGPGCVLERERLPDAERLAVHLEGALAGVVLDPEIVADREQLLTHPVLRPAVVASASQERHRDPPSPE
jgi:hypothetical protein